MATPKGSKGTGNGKGTPSTVNWGAVETDTAKGLPTRFQKSVLDGTPFMDWYEESWISGEARVLKGLTEEQAADAKRLVNLAVVRTGKLWNGEYKTGARHHTAQEQDGTYTYSFIAVDRTKDAGADAGEDEFADENGVESE